MADNKVQKAGMQAKMVRFENIFADHDRNVRMDSNLNVTPIPNFDPQKHRAGLYESIEMDGVKQPLTVAKLSADQIAAIKDKAAEMGVPNPLYRVIAGHRRHRVITMIRAKTADRFTEVPCLVYEGLTDADEIKLMMDHEHVQGLNEYEVYLSIKRLLMTGLSEEAVAVKMGKSRGFVQRRGWIAKLPPFVEENLRLKNEPPADPKNPHTFVKFTDKDLQTLYEASGKDRTNGLDPSNPESETGKVWSKLVTEGRAKAPEPKALTRKEILDKAGYVHDPLLKQIFMICAGEPNINLPDLVEEMEKIRKKASGGSSAGGHAAKK